MADPDSGLSLHERTKPNYRKSYIPLESDPAIFTELMRKLGVDGPLEFQDVLSLDDPDLLDFIPRPVLALVLIFPASDDYDNQVKEVEKSRAVYRGKGADEPVIWFAQTIHNACGLYAILHALSNGIDRGLIRPGSPLDNILTTSIPLGPLERALALENSTEIEAAHAAAAAQGSSDVPEAQDEVDHHYICFVRSKHNQHIYEMNGTAKGPIDTGVIQEGDDLLKGAGIDLVRNYIQRGGDNVGFSLLALVSA